MYQSALSFLLLVFGCMGGSWELVKIKIISKGIPLPDSCQPHLPWARERVPWIMWKISPDSTWCWLWCYKLYLLATGKFVRIKDFIGRFFDCLLGKCTLRVFFDKYTGHGKRCKKSRQLNGINNFYYDTNGLYSKPTAILLKVSVFSKFRYNTLAIFFKLLPIHRIFDAKIQLLKYRHCAFSLVCLWT